MARGRSGMIFERVAWSLIIKYKHEGKERMIEKTSHSKSRALESVAEITATLSEQIGSGVKVSHAITSKSLGWYARVTFTDQSGTRRYMKRHADNKTHAKELVKQLLRELDDNGDAVFDGSNTTVTSYLDQWLQTAAKPRLSERTYSDYQDLLRLYVRPTIGRKKLADLRREDIQYVYRDMERRGLSPHTIHYTHTTLSSALKQAAMWGLITKNPTQFVELPKQKRAEMQSLSPELARRFLEACATDKWATLFSLALATGMRPGEYLGLKWKDIDLDVGVITVQRTLCWKRSGGGYYFAEPKTPRSRRSIPVPSSLKNALIAQKSIQEGERHSIETEYEDLDLVFATAKGSPLSLRNLLKRHFKPILKRAGLPETIRLYDLRHSCATLLLGAQENPKIVSERLGHASITLTLDTYSHVLPSMQRAATDKLEQILFNTPAKKKERKTEKGVRLSVSKVPSRRSKESAKGSRGAGA